MSNEQTRYPLSWPVGWKRTPSNQRQRANFGKSKTEEVKRGGFGQPERVEKRTLKVSLSPSDAAKRLESELDRMGATHALLSTNQELRLDGTPRSDRTDPFDVGAAVYFTLNGKPRVLACDKWNRLADNIAAIAQHIDALRRIDRYGVGTLDQAFAGYNALPAKGTTWRTTLGFAPDAVVTSEMIDAAFRERSKGAHPDQQGGSHDAMASLTSARAEAREEIRLVLP